MFDYQEELGGCLSESGFPGRIRIRGVQWFFFIMSCKVSVAFFLFSIHREMDRFVCGFCSYGNDHGWFFLDFPVFMLWGFVILFSGVFPLGLVNLLISI